MHFNLTTPEKGSPARPSRPLAQNPSSVRGARVRLAALLLGLALLVTTLSGCSIVKLLLEPLPPAPTLPSETATTARPSPTAAPTPVVTSSASSATQTTTAGASSKGMTTRPGNITPTPGSSASSAAAFDARVRELLLAGVKSVSREIVLDEALAAARIPTDQADATIEHVFDLFQELYYSHPEFYFLNGQASASYSLLHAATSTLNALTIKPGFIDTAAGQTTAAILQRQTKLVQKAAAVAAAAKAASTDPVRQLLSIHDALVHLIRYDEAALANPTLNRERSNAASGLLDGLALCQGYAASFQLVAQQLGFEVKMPTGTAEGVNHAWDLVKVGSAWYHVDVTYDDPTPDGGSSAPVDHVHFLRSDARMRETHAWTAGSYPAAGEDSAAYYRLNSLVSASRSDLQKRINAFVASLPDPVTKASQIEVLYTGSDLPTLNDLEKMLSTALTKANYGGKVTYRRRVEKKIVLLEFLPA